MKFPLIAFCGYGGTGKDAAAHPLIDAGYRRVCFGDIIKRQLDALFLKHLGMSAFTEDRAKKPLVRRTLESWGEDNYDNIFLEFFRTLPRPAVNTRLCREREAREWVFRGGILVEVTREGVGPETPWALSRMTELRDSGLITDTVDNMGSLEELHAEVKRRYL